MDINKLSNWTILRVLTIVALFVGGLSLAVSLKHVLIRIVIAAFLAIALNPAVERLSRYLPRKSRGLAALLVFVTTFALIIFAIVSLAPPVVHQSQDFLRDLPHQAAQIQTSSSWLGELFRKYDLISKAHSWAGDFAGHVVRSGGSILAVARGLFGGLAALLTVVVMTVFFSIEGPEIVRRLWQLDRSRHRASNQAMVAHMYTSVTGYVLGNVFTSIICGVATGIMLAILRVPLALPLGLIVGFLDLLPLVGATLGAVITILFGLFNSVATGIILLVFFTIYQQVENNLLVPYVYGKTVQMSPLAVFISALIGASLGGLVGALVAVPVGASAVILTRELLDRYSPEPKVPKT